MAYPNNFSRKLANNIVDRLMTSLAKSTWEELHPSGYQDLKNYREDMVDDIINLLDDDLRFP